MGWVARLSGRPTTDDKRNKHMADEQRVNTKGQHVSTTDDAMTMTESRVTARRISAAIERLAVPPAGRENVDEYQAVYRTLLRLEQWLAWQHSELVDEIEALADSYSRGT